MPDSSSLGRMPVEQEFLEWRLHPVSRWIWAWLDSRVRSLQDSWASGEFERETVEQTALANARAVGRAQAFAEFLALNYEVFLGDMEHGEQIGIEASGRDGFGEDIRAPDEE